MMACSEEKCAGLNIGCMVRPEGIHSRNKKRWSASSRKLDGTGSKETEPDTVGRVKEV